MINKRNIFIFLYLIVIVMTFYSLENHSPVDFNKAVKLYKENDYEKALDIFKNLYINHYDNFNINYNMGCCYFKLQEYGRARFHFERALKFKPFDSDLFHNLKATYNKISNSPSDYEFIIMNKRIIYFFPIQVLIGIIITLFVFIIIFAILLLKGINFRLFLILIAISFFFVITFTSLFFIQYFDYNKKVCVVIEDEANIYLSPDDENAILKSISEGTKGKIVNETSQYYRVKFENNLNGWINKEDVISNESL